MAIFKRSNLFQTIILGPESHLIRLGVGAVVVMVVAVCFLKTQFLSGQVVSNIFKHVIYIEIYNCIYIFIFALPLLGEMIQFNEHVCFNRMVQPPTRFCMYLESHAVPLQFVLPGYFCVGKFIIFVWGSMNMFEKWTLVVGWFKASVVFIYRASCEPPEPKLQLEHSNWNKKHSMLMRRGFLFTDGDDHDNNNNNNTLKSEDSTTLWIMISCMISSKSMNIDSSSRQKKSRGPPPSLAMARWEKDEVNSSTGRSRMVDSFSEWVDWLWRLMYVVSCTIPWFFDPKI